MIEVCCSPYLMFINGEIKEARTARLYGNVPYAGNVKQKDTFSESVTV